MNKNEKSIHYSNTRSKTKASGQLVGIAYYMDAGLEANDSHTVHMYMDMYNDKFANLQQD